MPKKNNIKMTAEELIRKHQENQAALAELNKKNLKKACEDIFYMQSMADFAENGILSKINNPEKMPTEFRKFVQPLQSRNLSRHLMHIQRNRLLLWLFRKRTERIFLPSAACWEVMPYLG